MTKSAPKRIRSAKYKQDRKLYWVKYYTLHRERLLAGHRRYYTANKKRLNIRGRTYAAAHPQKIKELSAAWQANNKDKHAIAESKRRANQLHATPAWANPQKIAEYYETADGLNMLTGEWHHVDHIVPLRSRLVCGLHCEHNLRVMLGLENISKGNRHWPEMS